MRYDLRIILIWTFVLGMPTLAACTGVITAQPAFGEGTLSPMSLETSAPCEACAQATLAAALTQQQINADNQAEATAEIARANAQATLNSANATFMEKHVRFTSGTASEDGSTDDVHDRQFGNYLNSYYDQVITMIRDANTIQIFDPGEAKGELKKRLERAGLTEHIVAIDTVDKMSDRQIAAKVRERIPV